jgi:hypothetical protein
MELPADLAASEMFTVSGRQGWTSTQSVRFGAWEAKSIDRSWTRGNDLRFNEYERNRRRQGYAFTLNGEASTDWRVECLAGLLVRGATVHGVTIEGTNRSSLDCELRPAGSDATFHLVLAEEGEKPLTGMLNGPATAIQVIGTNRMRGGVVPAGFTTGYRFEQAGRALAAVDVMNDGTVRFRAGTDAAARSAIAAAATALLLLEDLRATL